jgi:hypothetical protein
MYELRVKIQGFKCVVKSLRRSEKSAVAAVKKANAVPGVAATFSKLF